MYIRILSVLQLLFVDVWREFVGNNIDLQYRSVINWFLPEEIDEQVKLLVDGDKKTCLMLNSTFCDALKVVYMLLLAHFMI